ncbi:hypothetical protein AB0K34_13535 [Actinomadura sp. NPDC049382]|uniref:hypothetical protein n=1 Tax=Actinomadura sp. NPDC049382 TaxID=3158220 RepID=UPI0034450DA1
MALLTLPKSPTRRGKHAARTPLWRQIGIGRARHDLTAAPLVSPPAPEPAVERASEPTPVRVVSSEQARTLIGWLFPPGADGLYPLDWRYEPGRATAQVDPGLVPDAARNVVLAYAAEMAAAFVQEQVDDRLHMRVSRAVDGVQVTVWADITPEPQQLALPAAEPPADPVLPIEEGVRRCVLDETQTFPAITDDMEDPRTSPDGDPVEEPTGPDHAATPDPVAVADEPAGERSADPDAPADDEPGTETEDDDTPATDGEDAASTDTSDPLPLGDEDELEEVAVHG